MDGRFNKAIHTLYSCSVLTSMIMFADRFDTPVGRKQENIFSPTLIAIFFHDIALQIKGANTDRCLDDFKWGIILYTDNIVLLAECHLQNMLNVVSLWCYK